MNYSSPRRRRQKKDHEKILEVVIVENFPKMGKEIITQVQEGGATWILMADSCCSMAKNQHDIVGFFN